MTIIEQMKDRVSMKELLEKYGVYPRRSTNNYTCLFHSPDDHPSAGITKDNKYFHCFSCGVSATILDVVCQIKQCDLKKALRIIDNDFKLGLYRELSQKEKLELAREFKERERQKKEKLYYEQLQKKVLGVIAKKLREEEKLQEICKQAKGKAEFGIRYDVYIDCEKRIGWLNWLYETLCGFGDKPMGEFDCIYGNDKLELLKAIEKGELSL